MHLSPRNPSDKLSTGLDSEVDKYLKLSINFSLYKKGIVGMGVWV